MNDWYRILEAFRVGKFPNYIYGLTPRFILGGCQIPIGRKFETEDLALEATKQMFEEMRVYNKAGLVVVSNKCGIHDGPVMSFAEYKWSESTISTSFEEIWNRYGQEIVNGEYHIDADERKILQSIFK